MASFVIAAGGTAGHVVPALAVGSALRADGHDVTFIGGERAEARLVPEAGFPLRVVPGIGGLDRKNPLKAARGAARAAAGVRIARGLLRELRPDAVLGGGGYVAGVVGAAAVARRVPLVLTEADSHLGLSNRALARFARRVCLAFPVREGGKYVVTGRPVPAPATDRQAARERFGLAPTDTCVLVFGGSLGARSINHAAIEAFADAPFRVLHVAGERDFPSLQAPGPHYDLRAYLDRFGEALLACDLCVARAGGSVFEVAAAGRPAVLVPYPHASADHQTGNARFFADAGAAVVVPDAGLDGARLAHVVGELLSDRDRLASMERAALALARPDAAERIAAELVAAARA